MFLINQLPSVSRQLKSPWECLFGSTPDYKSFRVFECTCYPLLRSYSKHKLQPRSVPCVFLGYASNAKGFLCYDISAQRFYVSRHVKFDENSFPYNNLPSQTSHSSSSLSVNSNTSSIWLSHLLFFFFIRVLFHPFLVLHHQIHLFLWSHLPLSLQFLLNPIHILLVLYLLHLYLIHKHKQHHIIQKFLPLFLHL